MSSKTIKILGGLAAGIAVSAAANIISKQVRGKYLVDPESVRHGMRSVGNEVKNLGNDVALKTKRMVSSTS